MQSIEEYARLLRLAPDMVGEVIDKAAGREQIAGRVKNDDEAYELFAKACRFEAPFATSWIHGPGENSPYLSLELAETTLDDERYRRLLAESVLSTSPSVPYDYRGLAAAELVRIGVGDFAGPLAEVVDSYSALPMRTTKAKIDVPTDGIDHLFDIPDTAEARIALIRTASELKTEESRYLIASRILGRGEQVAAPATEAERLIAEDVGSDLIAPADYLVPWDQEFPSPAGSDLTLAELMRIVLLGPEFKLPDARIRPVLVDFYRSVLRISGRSIIGLAAGVFHVEHGTMSDPSFYYQGRDSILGKGLVIDCVGGAILQQGTFLGGGFMPILIHTHKHIRKSGEAGAAERKRVLPCIFVAEAGARFPMHAVGLFETVDYLDEDTPFEGIRALPHGA
ncbi:hypothetical protein SAMN02982929_01604 [Saccharopolyspora kobensis]|uniref:Uncharacterized protein n=1 Tax=Saccharopolyspora kobensis TaxID=146035 RepID=A0A1H5XQ84_9PSEU|nr:hypothetical protein [Saccharopolyspora kobensis]SEG13929.1 hypothetical protein SAMN02982929_01604 [Saccharopolyspora kobensis]SFE39410.1 hypothetical protein SAMN05216506_11120 [Saccharopolyspora kobensis]